MKRKGRTKWLIALAVLAYIGFTVAGNLWIWPQEGPPWTRASTWQNAASPGHLSEAHAFLGDNCSACHTPVRGVTADKCIVCHANNEALLSRQPTAFHANISSCSECHIEHQGIGGSISKMDHAALSRIGLREMRANPDPGSEGRAAADQIEHWLRGHNTSAISAHAGLSAHERVLDCAACHKNDDRHFELFGMDCASCHSAKTWNLPEFIHPPPTSMDCAQCHQAPPSHYMKHFNMISQKVAGQPHAKVEQCYSCHQTTSWPDIKGAGWYKHH